MNNALDEIVYQYLLVEANKNTEANVSTSETDTRVDQEFLQAVHECLNSKGITRQLKAFLRSQLVAALNDKWPHLVHPNESTTFHPAVMKLLQDFLCCHKLLFTVSVLACEIDDKCSPKDHSSRLSLFEAEDLLHSMKVRRDSALNREILKKYSQSENTQVSLLECIISIYPRYSNDQRDRLPNDIPSPSNTVQNVNDEIQMKAAIQKFRSEEEGKLRESIETKLRFEMLAKEKELLQNYEEKVDSLTKHLDREKESWYEQRHREEQELTSLRQHLVALVKDVVNKRDLLQTMLAERKSDETKTRSLPRDPRRRKFLVKEAQMSLEIRRLQDENCKLKSGRQDEAGSVSSFESYELKPLHTNRKMSDSAKDKVAMLQYMLETQAEEIRILRKTLHNDNSRPKPFEKPETRSRGRDSLDDFLRDSQRRCEDIEKESKEIEKSLVKLCQIPIRSNGISSFRDTTDENTTRSPPVALSFKDTFNLNVPSQIPASLSKFFEPGPSLKSILSVPVPSHSKPQQPTTSGVPKSVAVDHNGTQTEHSPDPNPLQYPNNESASLLGNAKAFTTLSFNGSQGQIQKSFSDQILEYEPPKSASSSRFHTNHHPIKAESEPEDPAFVCGAIRKTKIGQESLNEIIYDDEDINHNAQIPVRPVPEAIMQNTKIFVQAEHGNKNNDQELMDNISISAPDLTEPADEEAEFWNM